MFDSRKIVIGLSIFFLAIILSSLLLTGLPVSKTDITQDNKRISDFNTIKYSIETYYQGFRVLPPSLTYLSNTNIYDPKSGQMYVYNILSTTSYRLCANFAADSNTNGYYSQTYHRKGYYCITYYVYAPTPTPTPYYSATTYYKNDIKNPYFLEWYGTVPTYWSVSSNGKIIKAPGELAGDYAVEINNGKTALISDKILLQNTGSYELNISYNTLSDCTTCGFIGLQFFDVYNNVITEKVVDNTNLVGCTDRYIDEVQAWVKDINFGKSRDGNYRIDRAWCSVPVQAKYAKVVFGVWNEDNEQWLFNYVSMSADKSALGPRITPKVTPYIIY